LVLKELAKIHAEKQTRYLALKRGKEMNWRVTDVFPRNLFLLSGSNYRVTKSSKPVKRHKSH